MWIYRGKFNWRKWADNEGITIVFFDRMALGGSVGAYWQWSETASGKRDVNFSSRTTIHASRHTHSSHHDATRHSVKILFEITIDTSLRLMFTGNFAFTSSDLDRAPAQIRFRVRGLNRDAAQFLASRRTFSPDIVSPHFPGYRVYVGRLDRPDGKNEMIVIILPYNIDYGHPVCAYWQWSGTSPLDKRDAHLETTMHSCESHSDGSHFSFEEGDIVCKATVHESLRHMEMTMLLTDSHSQPASHHSRLRLIDTPTTKHPNPHLRVGPLGHNTSIILNDTSIPIHCIVEAAADGYRGRTMAIAGFFLAALGVIPALGAVATASGVLGFGLSVVGLLDVFGSVEEPLVQLIFPNESARRTSSAAIPLLDYNAATLIRFSLDNGTLMIDMGKRDRLTEQIYRVSAFVQDKEFWTRVISIPVRPGTKLTAYRMITVEGWRPTTPAKPITSLAEVILTNGSVVSWHKNASGEAVLAEHPPLSSPDSNTTLFTYGPSPMFGLVYNQEDKFEVERDNSRAFPLLILLDCAIVPKLPPGPSPARVVGRNLGDHETQESVIAKINETQSPVAWSWQVFFEPKKHLFGYSVQNLNHAEIVKRTGAMVFLRAREWSPWLQLTPPSASRMLASIDNPLY